MDFRVLGPLEVGDEDRSIDLGGPKQRAVLAHLLLSANRVVPVDRLIDEIWGEEPPEAVLSSLQASISRLRRLLGSDRIEGRPAGYMLRVEPDEIDALRFEALVRHARRLLATDPRRSSMLLGEALELWRGRPLSDVPGGRALTAAVAALEEVRLKAFEERVAVELALGNEAEMVGLLESWLAENALRERLWAQLMVALYRSARQAEALDAYARARRLLRDELGVDPSPELRRLQLQVLNHDPELEVRALPLRGYHLLERIGEGTFGVVHRAVQPGLGREVALKAIRPRLAHHPDFIRRFEAEAQLVARLEHPHIVPLYDYWRDADGAYLVMRWLRGGSLRDSLASGPLPLARAADVTDQIASALAAAHRAGIVHRDVKPANILLDDEGNSYLSDFGIAKDVATAAVPDSLDEETTRYLSPEEVRGEPVTPRTDVYSLGIVVYEMLCGRHPFADARPADGAAPPPGLFRPELPTGLDDVLARALAADPDLRHADAPALAAELRRHAPSEAPTTVLEQPLPDNPYKGLQAFDEGDAADFFGREALVSELIERLAAPGGGRLLAVVGASGSGKSSLVRAGLLPALRAGAIPCSDRWFVAEMRPGGDPLAELTEALLRVTAEPLAGLEGPLRGDARGLAEAVEAILPSGSELVLVVDQFEELFTLTGDGDQRNLFLDELARAVGDPAIRLRVVITLRADYYDRPLAHHGLAALLRSATAVVIPLSPEEIERAISGPAARRGMAVEPALVARVVADVADQPGALPVLQYALTEMFDRRSGASLTLADYEAIGGISGAIARRADEIYLSLDPAGQQAAEQLFLRLVTLGEGAEDTRRRVTRAELETLGLERDALEATSVLFGAHRLLSFDRDPQSREPTIEVAHEALLREWPRLRQWIDSARDDLRQQRGLARPASEWAAAGRDVSFLLRGSRLAHVRAWAAETGLPLGELERDFIAASSTASDAAEAAEAERQAREHRLERRAVARLRALVAVLGVGVLVTAGLAGYAFDQQRQAQQQARVATARELAAAALAKLAIDPDLAILLAIESVEVTRMAGQGILRESEEALHTALASTRIVERRPSDDTIVSTLDSRYVATLGERALTVHEAASGAQLISLPAERIFLLAVAPDGGHVATVAGGGRATVWQVGPDRPTALPGTDVAISALAFSPDGSRLAAMAIDGAARVFDLASWEQVAEIPLAPADAPSGGGQSLAWSPDGSTLAVANGSHTILARLEGDEPELLDGDGLMVAFSPDGVLLLTSGQNTATLWDAQRGVPRYRLGGHVGFVPGVSFSADSRLAATGSHDGLARVWDTASGELLFALSGLGGEILAVRFDDAATRLTGSGVGGELVWDLTANGSRELLTFRAHTDLAPNITYDPAGERLATASFDGAMRVWRASDGELLLDLPGTGPPASDVVFSADGTLVATAGFDGLARLWDASRGKLLRVFEGHTAALWAVAFSPDARRLVTASEDRTARVWDVETGALLTTFGEHNHFVYDAAWHPDGSVVVSVGNDAVARIWDPTTGDQIRALTGHAENVVEQAFSPDGTRLATAAFDATAKVWQVATGEELLTLAGHGGIVLDVESSPDGSRWATASLDGTVRLWDAASGRELLTLRAEPPVGRLAFSPDGRHLAGADTIGQVRVFVLDPEALVAIAQERVSRPLTEAECRQYLHLDHCP